MTLYQNPTSAAEESFNAKVAIVMPVYNEGATIESTVMEIKEKVISRMPNASIFIFEDGSKDNTKEAIIALADRFPWIRAHTSPERKGYPRAVKDAIASIDESEYGYIVFMDSDGQYDPNDFFKLWDLMLSDNDLDIVMARRTNRAEPAYRVILSSGLRVIEKVLFSPPCKDVTSAFRLMKTGVAKEIARQVKYSKYNFWLEFTARMSKENYRVMEVEIPYRSREGEEKGKSKVYSVKRMPRILRNELGAVFRTWLEYNKSQFSKFLGVGISGSAVIL